MTTRAPRRLAALLAVAVLASACYGPFRVTRDLHSWNGTVTSNKFGQELIFLALNIIPVYGIVVIGDVLIFNTIDFWSGSSPDRVHETPPDVDVTVVDAEGVQRVVTFTQRDGCAAVVDAEGTVLATASTCPSGAIEARDAQGRLFARSH